MKTSLKIKSAGSDPHVLLVYSNAGDTYYYGVFPTHQDAIDFGKAECNGFRYEAKRLNVIERG